MRKQLSPFANGNRVILAFLISLVILGLSVNAHPVSGQQTSVPTVTVACGNSTFGGLVIVTPSLLPASCTVDVVSNNFGLQSSKENVTFTTYIGATPSCVSILTSSCALVPVGTFAPSNNCTLTEPLSGDYGFCSVDWTPGNLGSTNAEVKVVAHYNGDICCGGTGNLPTDGSTVFGVITPVTTTNVNCGSDELAIGGYTVCTARVTSTDFPGIPYPSTTGTVSWSCNFGQCGNFNPSACIVVSTGTNSAICAVTFTANPGNNHDSDGSHGNDIRITGTYSGDKFHTPSQGTTTIKVTHDPNTESND